MAELLVEEVLERQRALAQRRVGGVEGRLGLPALQLGDDARGVGDPLPIDDQDREAQLPGLEEGARDVVDEERLATVGD